MVPREHGHECLQGGAGALHAAQRAGGSHRRPAPRGSAVLPAGGIRSRRSADAGDRRPDRAGVRRAGPDGRDSGPIHQRHVASGRGVRRAAVRVHPHGASPDDPPSGRAAVDAELQQQSSDSRRAQQRAIPVVRIHGRNTRGRADPTDQPLGGVRLSDRGGGPLSNRAPHADGGPCVRVRLQFHRLGRPHVGSQAASLLATQPIRCDRAMVLQPRRRTPGVPERGGDERAKLKRPGLSGFAGGLGGLLSHATRLRQHGVWHRHDDGNRAAGG